MMVKRNWGEKHSNIIQNQRTLIRQDPITGAYHGVDPRFVSIQESTLVAQKNPKMDVENGLIKAIGDQQADFNEMHDLA